MSVGSHKDNYHMLQWCKSTKASHIECWIMLNTVHLVFFEKWQTACPKILILWHCMCPKAETAKGPAGRMLQRVRRGSRSFHHSFTGHTRDISGPMNAEKQIIRRRQEWHYVTFQSFLFHFSYSFSVLSVFIRFHINAGSKWCRLCICAHGFAGIPRVIEIHEDQGWRVSMGFVFLFLPCAKRIALSAQKHLTSLDISWPVLTFKMLSNYLLRAWGETG